MEELIKKIKSKKPLDRLDNTFVQEFVEDFFKTNYKIKKKFSEGLLKKKDEELIIKSVRNELNKMYGQFWNSDDLELEAHKSSKERLEFYDKVYSFIFSITGKPKKVLDLGCGLNPLSYKDIKDGIYFIATELTNYDCEKIRYFFKKNEIKGEVIKSDLRTYSKFPEVDVCFMFKILDSLESKGHLLSEKLIKEIKAKYIVASFSTQNIKGKKMNYPRRGWIEIMLQRLGLIYTKYEESNEIFYIIKI